MEKIWVGSKFKVQKVPGSHHKERNRKKKMVPPRTVAVKGKERNEKKKRKKKKEKNKQWSHTMGKKSQGENAKKYGDSKNCWEGI